MFGIAFHFGVLDTLREHNLRLTGHTMLGTSAGSWVASALVTGRGVEDFLQIEVKRVPTLDTRFLHRIALELFGTVQHPDVSAVAVDIRNGRRRRLSGADHPLADLVSASSAIPGVYPPFPIGGRRYLDGGLLSLASADLGAPAHNMLVIAPLSGVRVGLIGAVSSHLLRRECRRWSKATGGKVTVVEPPYSVSKLTPTPWHMMDSKYAKPVYEETRRWAETAFTRGPLAEALSSWSELTDKSKASTPTPRLLVPPHDDRLNS